MRIKHSTRIKLIATSLAYENVTKEKTRSAGYSLLKVVPDLQKLDDILKSVKEKAIKEEDVYLKALAVDLMAALQGEEL